MTRTLVTGGAGFLGSHLCQRLIQEGDEVICLDNFSTGSRPNIAVLEGHSRFEIIRHDVIHPIRHLRVDRIFNLACPASPVAYQQDPIGTWKTNVLGMLNILDLAQACSARVVQASTSEVYGDPSEQPQIERYTGNVDPIGPRACYDEGKRAAEALCADYVRQRGIDVRIARIFNTYGPHMAPDDGRVVSAFLAAVIRDEPLVIHDRGDQTRAFCYVEDTVDGLRRLMGCPESNLNEDEVRRGRAPIEAQHRVFNIGNPVEVFTVEGLARKILVDCGKVQVPSDLERWIKTTEARPGDPQHRRPDIRRAKEVLAWSPLVDLSTGLRHTYDWMVQALNA